MARHVHTVPTPIVPPAAGAIPTFAQSLEVPTHSQNLTINCEIDNNDAADITHYIYGYLRGLSDDAIELLSTYENLETIPTQGKYNHCIKNATLRFRAIGVRETIGSGSMNSRTIVMNLQ